MNKFNLYEIKKGKLVLEALMKYGAMNMRTLSEVLPEYKTYRNLKRTVSNLCERKLVAKRYEQINGGKSVFYQLNQKSFIREALAYYLDTHPDRLLQKTVPYKELSHEQTVAQIHYYLSTQFPEAIILKDDEIHHNAIGNKVIAGSESADAVKPDLLFIYQGKDGLKPITIAIEYERTLKSRDRIVQKLNYYAQKTLVDGVLYIYPDSMIDHNVHHSYFKNVMSRACRVKDYGHNFLLTSELSKDIKTSFEKLKNRSGNYYDFNHWLGQLLKYNEHNRIDKNF